MSNEYSASPCSVVMSINRYLQNLRSRGRSSATLDAYFIDIRAMIAWFAEVGISLLKATEADIVSYIRSREIDGAKPATIARAMSTLGGFFKFLVISGDIAESPMASLRKPQVRRVPKPLVTLTPEELSAIFTHSDPSKIFEKRNKLLLKFLVMTRMKESELVELKASDVDLATGTCMIRGRKGNESEILLVGNLLEQTRDYIENYREDVCVKVDSEYLFPSRSGGHLSRTALWHIIKMSVVRSGVRKEINVEALRRSYLATTDSQT